MLRTWKWVRSPRANARAERTRGEVGVAFLGACLDDATVDAHLPFQLDPVEKQARVRIGGQFVAFAAFVIREEDEALFVHALDEQDPRGRTSVLVHRGERHRVWFGQFGVERLGEPFVELLDRVGIHVGHVE